MRVYFITRWSKPAFFNYLFSLPVFLFIIAAATLGFFAPRFLPGLKSAWEPPLTLLELALREGLPDLSLVAPGQAGAKTGYFWEVAQNIAGPLKFLDQETLTQPVTAQEYWPLPDGESPPPPPPPEKMPPADSKHPLVAIYNTHNSESYRPTEGSDKFPGKNGGVSRVAGTLAQALTQDYGISVVRSTTIHDYPDFTRSYINSEQTLRKILAQNPSIQVVLDIHRDAGLQEAPVVEINGQKVAQILLIVGTDARLKHPNWRQNEAFARRVEAKMNELYPGLCRGIRLQEGRYNQHLHPRALLIEIGSNDNTLEEAENAAKLLARVVAEIIKDLRQESIL
ncbi:MAG: stage sporulation protein [Clostridia bacterium]|nr:stage sporulation protein [Clostridia bacterium]